MNVRVRKAQMGPLTRMRLAPPGALAASASQAAYGRPCRPRRGVA